ncbi:hypothetical protein H8E07_07045, partial [bacterium]|nr:hypothetical protein [bacterium]
MKTLTTFIVFGVCLLTVGALLGQPIFDHAIHAEQDLACEDCHLPPST